MARGRQASTLGKLERELAQLNARRHQVINQMKAAMDHLTLGSAAPMAGLGLGTRIRAGRRSAVAAVPPRPRRNVSAAVRARLSRLAKARWAQARKEGKKRLG